MQQNLNYHGRKFLCTMTNHHLICPAGGFYFLLIVSGIINHYSYLFVLFSEYNSIIITRQQCFLNLYPFIERMYVATALNS